MNNGKRYTALGAIAAGLLAVAVLAFFFAPSGASADHADPVYRIRASEARLNRQIMGDVTAHVQGVPAEPVDSFTWDGEGRVELANARLQVTLNPTDNTGWIRATWTDRNGDWRFEQTVFMAPEHAAGARLTATGMSELVEGDPMPANVYLHGDTTAGGPVLPTIFNYVATWGPAAVTLNGKPFANPYQDGSPAPLWVAHTMTTEGVRNADGTVTVNGGAIYHPGLQGEAGDIDASDLEFHLVFHDAPTVEPEAANIPPFFSFFYHLTFEEVKLQIK
ncbi:MAG: hypothetical protein R3272_09470 [Candidatus Promineifilaceae bacterium]|nr:hypothetical protein [Candidatus Promineifilaceae bacterium]